MINSMVVSTLPEKHFTVKFGAKNENSQFKLKFGT